MEPEPPVGVGGLSVTRSERRVEMSRLRTAANMLRSWAAAFAVLGDAEDKLTVDKRRCRNDRARRFFLSVRSQTAVDEETVSSYILMTDSPPVATINVGIKITAPHKKPTK